MIEDDPIKRYVDEYNRNREADLAKYELRKAGDAKAKRDREAELNRKRVRRHKVKAKRDRFTAMIKPSRDY